MYEELLSVPEILDLHYEEVNGYDYYLDIFPNNETSAERGVNTDFSKPNAIFLYWTEPEPSEEQKPDDPDTSNGSTGTVEAKKLRGKPHRRIMLADKWHDDFIDYVEQAPQAFCSGCSFRGRSNRIEHAQKLHAIIIDLDYVDSSELLALMKIIGKPRQTSGRIKFDVQLPQPTYIVHSGTGLHIVYVFDTPIDLYPDVAQRAYKMKKELTRRAWWLGITTKARKRSDVQYQSIVHNYRMVGSFNSKHGNLVRAWKTGEKVPYSLLNGYVDDEDAKIKYREKTKGGRYDKTEKFWTANVALYRWWLSKVYDAVPGHRFYFMLATVAYAKKCGISFKTLKYDLYAAFETLKTIKHDNPLTEKDIRSALKSYQRPYFHKLSIDKIIDMTQIPITKNKRNGRKQAAHLELMRGMKELKKKLGMLNGSEGRPSKQAEVENYLSMNPDATVAEIMENTGVSHNTAYKYRQPQEKPPTASERIAAYLKEHPDADKQSIAEALGISVRTVYRNLK